MGINIKIYSYWINWRKEFIESFVEYPPHEKQEEAKNDFAEPLYDNDDYLSSDEIDESISSDKTDNSTPGKKMNYKYE